MQREPVATNYQASSFTGAEPQTRCASLVPRSGAGAERWVVRANGGARRGRTPFHLQCAPHPSPSPMASVCCTIWVLTRSHSPVPEIRHAFTYIPSCDVARSVRGERLERVREEDHGVLRDESAAVKKQIALFSLDIIEGHGCVAHTRSQPSATERTLSSLFGNLDGLRSVSSAFRAVTSGIVVAHRRNLDTLQLLEVRHDDARDRRVREHAAAPPPRRYRPEPGRGGRRKCCGCAGRACGDREHRRGRARARAHAALLTQLRAKVQLPLCLTIVSCLRGLCTLVLEQQHSRRAAAATTAKRLRPARPATRRAAATRRRRRGRRRGRGGGAHRMAHSLRRASWPSSPTAPRSARRSRPPIVSALRSARSAWLEPPGGCCYHSLARSLVCGFVFVVVVP